MTYAGIALVAVSALLFWLSKRSGARAGLMTATETTRVGDVARLVEEVRLDLRDVPGAGEATGWSQFAELKGRITCDQPISGELSGVSSAVCDTRVERQIETRHESRDERGGVRTEWRRSSETVSQNRREVPFFLDDGTGRVRVATTGVKLDLEKVVDRFEPPAAVEQGSSGQVTVGLGSFRLSIGGGPATGRRTVGYRFEERVLPVGREVYALGEIADTSDGLVLRRPESHDRPFVLSLRSESDLVRSDESARRVQKLFGLALGAAGVALAVIGLLQ